jgi:hypothetical protein
MRGGTDFSDDANLIREVEEDVGEDDTSRGEAIEVMVDGGSKRRAVTGL